MAMLAAINTFGIIMGNTYRSHTGLKANPYIICLADTGEGKDWPRCQAKHLLTRCGRAGSIGADVWGSDSGFEREIAANNEILWLIDELNPFLRDIKNPNCPAYKLNIVTLLLTMSGGKAYSGKSLKSETETIQIDDPMPSIYACAQPDIFFSMLDSELVDNGFVNRNLIFLAHWVRRIEYGRKPKLLEESLPPELLKYVRDAQAGSINIACKAANIPQPIVRFRLSDAAQIVDEALHNECETKRISASSAKDGVAKNIVVRSQEKIYRLAMIHAWSKDWRNPVIEPDSLEWAWRMVRISDEMIISRCLGTKVADGRYEKNMSRILAILRKLGDTGITQSNLMRKVAMPSDMFRDIIRVLTGSEQIRQEEVHGGRGIKYIINPEALKESA